MKRNNNYEENNITYIKFMRRKVNYRIKLLFNILIFSGITIAASIILFLLIFNYKYKELIDKAIVTTDSYSDIGDYSKAIDNVKNSLVTIASSEEALSINKYIEGNTTGIIIQDSGRILVNYSKIKGFEDIYVNLPFVKSNILKAEIIFINENNDVAVLQVNSKEKLIPIKITMRDEVTEGEKVLLISNSTSDEYIDNLIPGIITSSNRTLEVEDEEYNLFEINIPINKFNDGGIISNLKGEVIGVASEKISEDMGINGLYYALDLSSLDSIIDSANEIKDILGITKGGFVKEISENHSGLYVSIVDKNGDLYKAGIRSTDIILKLDDIRVDNISSILEMLKNKENGDTVTCKIIRGKEIIDYYVTLTNIKK